MPRYRALQTLFVDGSRIRAGQEFVSSGSPVPGAWELLDASAAPSGPPVDGFAIMSPEELVDFIETKTGRRPSKAAQRGSLERQARAAAGSTPPPASPAGEVEDI